MLTNIANTIKASKILDIASIVFASAIFFILIFVNPGPEGYYDVMMYHAYNGWAGVNGTPDYFLHPAYTHSYFSNYLDTFSWLIIDSFNTQTATIILGMLQLTSAVPIYFISQHLLPSFTRIRILAITIMALSAELFIVQLGGLCGDIFAAIPVLFSIWMILKYVDSNKKQYAVYAAILYALALAFKITNAGYILIFVALACFMLVKRNYSHVIYAVVTGALSFIVFMTPYFVKTLDASGGRNPFFPTYNNIFKAENFPEIPYNFSSLQNNPSEYLNYIVDKIAYSLQHDIRFSILLLCLVLFFIVISARLLGKMFFNKPASGINKKEIVVSSVFFVNIFFYSIFFGIERYSMAFVLLYVTFIFYFLNIILRQFKNVEKTKMIASVFTALISFAIFATSNPSMFAPYITPAASKMFPKQEIKELQKYDAIILIGPIPVQASWLIPVTSEYILKHKQAWLSTAFNRIDAEASDKILANRKEVGYVTQAGQEQYSKLNLATLGYTTTDTCAPLSFNGHYGPVYETLVVCKAKYTGDYQYNFNPEDKLLAVPGFVAYSPTTHPNWFSIRNYR